jgi:hypothetical protein
LTIVRLGTNTAATAFQVRSDDESVRFEVTGAASSINANVNLNATAGLDVSGAALTVADNVTFSVGAGSDLEIIHDATNTTITSQTNNLVIDNTDSAGATILQLGTDDANTKVEIQNDSGTALFSAFGNSVVGVNDDITLRVGTGDDLALTHDGSDSFITSNTGNLIVDNQNATGSTVSRLGTATSATSHEVQRSTGTPITKTTGDGVSSFLTAFGAALNFRYREEVVDFSGSSATSSVVLNTDEIGLFFAVRVLTTVTVNDGSTQVRVFRGDADAKNLNMSFALAAGSTGANIFPVTRNATDSNDGTTIGAPSETGPVDFQFDGNFGGGTGANLTGGTVRCTLFYLDATPPTS